MEYDMTVTQRRTISAAVLKNAAIVLMFINHFSVGWYRYVIGRADWYYNFQWYLTRPAFILFAFMIAEGMVYTRSREKYMLRLLSMGIVSEFFYDKLIAGLRTGAHRMFSSRFFWVRLQYIL